jgi:endonuclease/exonuclease/phosphatase family metal-dependent hydrolase
VSSYDITPDLRADRTCPAAGRGAAAVDWYFPVNAGDNERLDRWCGSLGPVVLESVPAAPFRVFEPGDSVVVAVWNTDAGAGYLTAFLEAELGLQCDGDASSLRDGAPHVVLLVQEALRRSNEIPDVPKSRVTPPPVQEHTHPGPRLDVVEVARHCGLSHFYAPAARNDYRPRDGKREDKGNAILATLPLSDPIVVELPFEAARRVVPLATVRDAAGNGLRVASVHLITTPPPWRALVTGGSSRHRQALGLVDALQRIEDGCRDGCPIATVAAGDLNTWSTRETTLRYLREHFPDSPPPLAEPTRGPFPTDHLMFRAGAGGVRILPDSYRRVDDPYYSDHHPIVATFRFGQTR